MEILISIITGLLGGGGMGGILKKLSLGKVGNLVTGGIGGLLGSLPQLGGLLEGIGGLTGNGSTAVAGAAGGGILMTVVGLIKKLLIKK